MERRKEVTFGERKVVVNGVGEKTKMDWGYGRVRGVDNRACIGPKEMGLGPIILAHSYGRPVADPAAVGRIRPPLKKGEGGRSVFTNHVQFKNSYH